MNLKPLVCSTCGGLHKFYRTCLSTQGLCFLPSIHNYIGGLVACSPECQIWPASLCIVQNVFAILQRWFCIDVLLIHGGNSIIIIVLHFINIVTIIIFVIVSIIYHGITITKIIKITITGTFVDNIFLMIPSSLSIWSFHQQQCDHNQYQYDLKHHH